MKTILKIIVLVACFVIVRNCQPAMAASAIYPCSADPGINIYGLQLSEFIKLSVKDFSKIAGKKMDLRERISFSLLKRDMKKALRSHPDQTVKDYLETPGKKPKKILIIIGIVLVLIMLAFIILGSMDWSFGGG